MRVLVTGGAGFIGSKIVKVLVEQDHQVTVFDNLSTGHSSEVHPQSNFVEGDIRDLSLLTKTMKNNHAVIHLAAQAIVPQSIANPELTFDINLNGGHNVLLAMRQNNVPKLVYSSTAAVYGQPISDKLIKEDDPTIPISPYGASKLGLEHLCYSFYKNYGISTTVFRYFNPFGPGENHEPETHAIPNFIRAIVNNQRLPLYWNGRQLRDFFYVNDLAQAHVQAIGLDGFETINLGSARPTKVIDIIAMLEQIIGTKADVEDLGERPGDPDFLAADVSRAQQLLNWTPTPLEEALRLTVSETN